MLPVIRERDEARVEVERLRAALGRVANWKEFYDRNVGSWDTEQQGALTIGNYVRSVLREVKEDVG